MHILASPLPANPYNTHLAVNETRVLVRVQVQQVSLRFKKNIASIISLSSPSTFQVLLEIPHTGSRERMGPSGRPFTMKELYFLTNNHWRSADILLEFVVFGKERVLDEAKSR
jgi:hypothetical protein